jgi:diguanylate cyclase (GGDEF)-like protein
MEASILTIDDSLPMHRLIQSVFGSTGIAFHAAYDGDRGLTLAAQYRPNVILLDVDLPGMDGFEVCKRLKSSGETSPIPVIFLTADLQNSDKARGIDLGAEDYITKPFKPEALLASVRSSIAKKEMPAHSATQPIPGLKNRPELDEFLAAETAAAIQEGKPLSCIQCDVDELRIINSRFGQTAGDQALVGVAQALMKLTRPGDMVADCGGGRFAIAAPGLDRRDAGRMAQRMSDMIRTSKILQQGGEVRMTCTFGIADAAVAAGYPLMERAEGALKRAKLNGRASVSVARPPR